MIKINGSRHILVSFFCRQKMNQWWNQREFNSCQQNNRYKEFDQNILEHNLSSIVVVIISGTGIWRLLLHLPFSWVRMLEWCVCKFPPSPFTPLSLIGELSSEKYSTSLRFLRLIKDSNPVRAWIFFRFYFQLLVSVEFLAARIF